MHRLPLLVTALVLAAAGSEAKDHNPPPWRGQPLSTFQHWTFPGPTPHYDKPIGPDSGPQAPDKHRNPYVTPLNTLEVWVRGLHPPKVEWLDTIFGMNGVWRLETVEWGGAWAWGYLQFDIPNADRKGHMKDIRIQVTSREVAGPPDVFMNEMQPPPKYWAKVDIVPDGLPVTLPNGTTHRTFKAELPDCPSAEHMTVFAPAGGAIYVDQVVVDTICRPIAKQQEKQED